MSKHTPGPWKIVDAWNYYMVEGQNDEEIIWQDGPYQTPVINKANACLIAAAPDLLEALEAIVGDSSIQRVSDDLHAKARAAIAKAKGEV